MGRVFDSIDDSMKSWLEAQPVFFVGTAPANDAGHVNVSPKGGAGIFQVIGPTRVAYLDLIGSGAETIAHLRENGRIVLMFCAFDGPPKVIRLYGTGCVVESYDPRFGELSSRFAAQEDISALARTAIVIDVERIADSCGFMVPRMDFVSERDQLQRWSERQAERNGEQWKDRYVRANNLKSIDGLPALQLDEATLTDAELERFSSAGRAL